MNVIFYKMPMDQLHSDTSEMAREKEPSPPRKKQSALKKFVSVFKNRSKMEVGSVPPPLCFQEANEDSPGSSPKAVRRKFKNKKKERSSGDVTVWRPKVQSQYVAPSSRVRACRR